MNKEVLELVKEGLAVLQSPTLPDREECVRRLSLIAELDRIPTDDPEMLKEWQSSPCLDKPWTAKAPPSRPAVMTYWIMSCAMRDTGKFDEMYEARVCCAKQAIAAMYAADSYR